MRNVFISKLNKRIDRLADKAAACEMAGTEPDQADQLLTRAQARLNAYTVSKLRQSKRHRN